MSTLTLVGAIGGGLLGALVPGLGVAVGAELGTVLGGILGSVLFPNKIQDGPHLNDLRVMSSTAGAPIPFGYNLNRVAGEMIWTSTIKEVTTVITDGSGNKQRVFSYYADVAIAFGEGPASVGKIWGDSKLLLSSVPGQAYAALRQMQSDGSGTGRGWAYLPPGVTVGAQVTITGTNPLGSSSSNFDGVYTVINIGGGPPLADGTPSFDWNAGPNFNPSGIAVNGSIGQTTAGGQTITKLSMVGDLVTVKCNLFPQAGSQVLIIDIPQSLHANAYAGFQTVVSTTPTSFTYYNPSSPNLFTVGDDTGTVFCGFAVPGLPQYAPPTFYRGDELQKADPTIAAAVGAANCPAFRGLCYAVWRNLPLANFGNRIPSIRAEITFLNSIRSQIGLGTLLNHFQTRATPGPISNGSLTFTPSVPGTFVLAAVTGMDTGHYLAAPRWATLAQSGGGAGAVPWQIAIANLPDTTPINENLGNENGNPQDQNVFVFQGNVASLTAFISQAVITSNVLVCTTPTPTFNSFTVGQGVTLSGFVTSSFLNGQFVTVTAVAADGSSFTASFGHADYTSPDSGTATCLGYLQSMNAFFPSSPVHFALPNNVRAGSVLVVVDITGDVNSTGDITLVSDTQGDSWTIFHDFNVGCPVTAAACFSAVGGPTTITVAGNLNGVFVFEFPQLVSTQQGFNLQDMVTNLCKRSGLNVTPGSSQIDVSRLVVLNTQIPLQGPIGYAIGRPTTGAEAIKPLAQGYFFDGVETGGVIKFVPRGVPAVSLTIPEADLGTYADDHKIVESIAQIQDLPREIQVLFTDPALDYQQNKTHKRRHTRIVKTKNQNIVELPYTINANTARQIAEEMLFLDYLERKPYTFNTWKALYMLLDPTDVVQFTYEGLTFQARVHKTQIGVNYEIAFETVNENASVYQSSVQGSSGGGPPATIKFVPNTVLFLLDMPLLQDLDSNAIGSGYYAAASTTDIKDWTGYSLEEASVDTPSAYSQQDVSSSACSYGVTLSALQPPISPWSWDTVNSLTIRMLQGTLSSDTDINVLNGSNMLVVGNPAGYEVIQFANAALNADGSYTISRLLRGRRGTEVSCGAHTSADTVIVVNPLNVLREQVGLSGLQVLRYYRPLTFGQDINTVAAQTFTNSGNDLRPYAVTSVAASIDGSGNINVTWIRRTRIGGDWLNGSGTVPVSETSESYDVDVMGGPGSQTVVRTFAGLGSPSLQYTAAQQAADFGGRLTKVTLNIYQNSSTIGRGFQKNATVPTLS